jgi:cysteine-S-conjugate beta-lyase
MESENMKEYDFDRMICRKNTNSIKYDFMGDGGMTSDMIPMWVADMDFAVPDEVVNKLAQIAEHGIFGYSETKSGYFESVHDWFAHRHGFDTRPEWMIKTPGVVFAIAAAIRAFTEKGEGVLIQRPVYYLFEQTIKSNGRIVVNNPLVYKNGRYEIDFNDLERVLISEKVKLFIFCSPHNPVGRVWTKDELYRMGELCSRHDVIVVSDEIHCDFTYGKNVHTVFASLNEAFAKNSVICTAPSKTFNLAGLQASNIFIPDGSLRSRFSQALAETGYGGLNIFGAAACEAAYRYGGGWLSQLKDYLQGSLDLIRKYIAEHLPGVRLVEPEGTYLFWLDFTGTGLSDEQVGSIIKSKARLRLDEGCIFGPEGKGFQRINIACPRETLKTALERLRQAFYS